MRNFFARSIALVALNSVSSALAADLPSKALLLRLYAKRLLIRLVLFRMHFIVWCAVWRHWILKGNTCGVHVPISKIRIATVLTVIVAIAFVLGALASLHVDAMLD